MVDKSLFDKHKEVIGFIIEGKIFTGIEAISAAQLLNRFDKIITRAMAIMMDCLDLGPRWRELSQRPTLFYIDDARGLAWDENCILGQLKPKESYKTLWREHER